MYSCAAVLLFPEKKLITVLPFRKSLFYVISNRMCTGNVWLFNLYENQSHNDTGGNIKKNILGYNHLRLVFKYLKQTQAHPSRYMLY